MKMLKLLSITAVLAISLASCSSTSTQIIETGELELIASGPLFEGNNTATADWDNPLEGKKVKAAKIKSLEIWVENAEDFPEINKTIMELTAANTNMIRIAFKDTPLDFEEKNTLKLADNQKKIEKYFAANKITFVADLDISEDYFEDLILKLSATFEVEVQD
ncbi:MAG: hypothetical protein ACXITV_00525 [Luteibaculaceae bacterium]